VICDRVLLESNVLNPLFDGLRSADFAVDVFGDVTREPTLQDTELVATWVRERQPTAVIGVGGGSAMDLAKVAALLGTNDGPIDHYIGADLVRNPPISLALVPTTAGTGAETTRISMLASDSGKHIISDRMIVPLVAVLDIDLIIQLPRAVTAATGMDAIAHATEAFLSTSSSVLTVTMSLRAAQLLSKWLPVAYTEPDSRKARRATLYGAFLAGLGLNAGVVLGHSMAYTVANRVHLPHGVTTAMALPFCLAYNAAANVDGIDQLALAITGGHRDDVRSAGDSLMELNERLGMPSSLAAVGIVASELEAMAKECTTKYPRPTNPVPMTVEHLMPLYDAWFRGDLNAAWMAPR